ncbi:unnamed protein product [Lampetra fluviatilis]
MKDDDKKAQKGPEIPIGGASGHDVRSSSRAGGRARRRVHTGTRVDDGTEVGVFEMHYGADLELANSTAGKPILSVGANPAGKRGRARPLETERVADLALKTRKIGREQATRLGGRGSGFAIGKVAGVQTLAGS